MSEQLYDYIILDLNYDGYYLISLYYSNFLINGKINGYIYLLKIKELSDLTFSYNVW